MLPKESAVPNFDLPEDILSLLPSDPFEQLDIARKITSIALATRVSKLETESSHLHAKIGEKDQVIAELQSQIESLDTCLSDTIDKLAQADEEKESLLKENASLTNSLKRLDRDVAKLEVFKKTLMQSLKEEEDASQGGVPKVTSKKIQGSASFSSGSSVGEEDVALPPLKLSSMRTPFSQAGQSISGDGGSVETDGSRNGTSHGPLLMPYNSTPRLTPSASPPSLSAAGSPTRMSKAASPRRHSVSFPNARGMLDDRSPIYSSASSSQHSSMSGSSDIGSQSGRTRVDGKEFFRQVRSRLSYAQFGAFLANVKDLNTHKQTREETLRKADEIFGSENKDLFAIFEGLITRNVH
ncbi:hypothetical protein GIB67_034426 [Kingdonia uniflora]|uniref:At4g15545-like C-terminal domain-containing protein n=1 Tax=Kingdonia uniflora TaxID=39325 RepID=A0A7J7PBQ6_9MAGN|nr:hypothetical protein GIB67_034426 [Kingdonia uniflora]